MAKSFKELRAKMPAKAQALSKEKAKKILNKLDFKDGSSGQAGR